jgi:hypothetical protein
MRQKIMTPMDASSTAPPWISDHNHGSCWPMWWLNINVGTSSDPRAWLRTVKTMAQTNGTQFW